MNFEEIVQRAVNIEAKTGLKSIIIIQDSDIHCPQDHCSFNNTTSKIQIQEITAKNFSHLKEPKTKDPKLVFLHDNTAKPAKKKNK